MRHLDNRRIRFAWLLMLVYLPMMIAITFHHHTEAEGATAVSHCYECEHHIHHDGHLTAEHSFAHECVLCQLHSLPYVVPTLVRIAAFIAIVHVAFVVPCPFVKHREGCIHSTRAPPVLLSL
ncbi:hypothetical protein [Segatella sp.]